RRQPPRPRQGEVPRKAQGRQMAELRVGRDLLGGGSLIGLLLIRKTAGLPYLPRKRSISPQSCAAFGIVEANRTHQPNSFMRITFQQFSRFQNHGSTLVLLGILCAGGRLHAQGCVQSRGAGGYLLNGEDAYLPANS